MHTLEIAEEFRKAERIPLLHPVTGLTSGYSKTAKNFTFYWILDAGHMVGKVVSLLGFTTFQGNIFYCN